MSDYDGPGEGWREISYADVVRKQPSIVYWDEDDNRRAWIPEEPVPPLPTEPYTVIRVTWEGQRFDDPDISRVLTLVDGSWSGWDAARLRLRITGFEVLAEPRGRLDLVLTPSEQAQYHERVRRETAEAVIKRFLATYDMPWVRAIARDFGVES